MKKAKLVFIIFITFCLIFGAVVFLIENFKQKPGGIRVETTPTASVFINGVFVGKTPYIGTNPVGQINLKLVADAPNQNLFPYETKINLVSGIQTVIRREFGTTEENSSGDVLSFDNLNGSLAGLTVISNPDNSQILIDGASVGVSPYNFNSITTGKHKIVIKKEGYIDREISIKTVSGLKLTVFAKLAKGESPNQTMAPSPSPKSSQAEFVLIGNTPNGFLRMRTLPGTKGEEIAELKSGQKYKYLETDTESGWYKIQYESAAPGLPNGITGWVSNQYSTLSEAGPIPSEP